MGSLSVTDPSVASKCREADQIWLWPLSKAFRTLFANFNLNIKFTVNALGYESFLTLYESAHKVRPALRSGQL